MDPFQHVSVLNNDYEGLAQTDRQSEVLTNIGSQAAFLDIYKYVYSPANITQIIIAAGGNPADHVSRMYVHRLLQQHREYTPTVIIRSDFANDDDYVRTLEHYRDAISKNVLRDYRAYLTSMNNQYQMYVASLPGNFTQDNPEYTSFRRNQAFTTLSNYYDGFYGFKKPSS